MRRLIPAVAGLCLLLVLNASLHAQQVINVKSAPYNATGNGVTDDTQAIKAAIIALNNPANPSVLYFPPGTYVIDPTYVAGPVDFAEISRNGAWICGDGEKSILKRKTRPPMTPANGNGILTFISGTSHIKISDLSFDLNVCPSQDIDGDGILDDAPPLKEDDNHATALNLQNCNNIRVINCRFFSTQVIDYAYITANGGPFPNYNDSPTFHAVLSNGSNGCWVQNCRVENSQIKTAGGSDTTAQFVLDNSFYKPYNYAVSFVINNEFAQMRGCRISGNIIDGLGGAGGIYIGQDGSFPPTNSFILSYVQVCNNQIVGNWEQTLNPFGRIAITAHQTRLHEGWIIANNTVHPTSYSAVTNNTGIVASWPAEGWYGDMLFMNNSVSNLNAVGIEVSGGGFTPSMPVGDTTRKTSPAARIIGNHVHNTVYGIKAYGKRQLIIGNTSVGNVSSGLYLYAWTNQNDITMARVFGNEFRNSYQGSSDRSGAFVRADSGRSLTADFFANEFSDDQATHTQLYGIKHITGGTFNLRYFDNRLNGNINVPPVINIPGGTPLRDNIGW